MLKEGIEKMGRFEIVSKDVGVPLVAFSLKDSSKHTVFQISDKLRRFGWIVPAYTMAPDAQHIAVLRVVVREEFSRTLAERLVADLERVVREIDTLPSFESTKAAHITSIVDETQHSDRVAKHAKKNPTQMEEEVVINWRRLVEGKRTGVC